MENLAFYLQKLNYLIPGGFYGFLSMTIRISGDMTAAYLYPGYDPAIDMISFLGSGPGQLYFNFGLFFSSLTIIPFYVFFANILKKEFPEDEKLINSSLTISIISAISVFLVGFFLYITNYISSRLLYDFHSFFAIIAFSCGAYFSVVSGSLMKKSAKFPTIFTYMFYIVAVLSFLFLVIWQPLIEWISKYFMLFTYLILSIYMIYKKM